MTDTEKCNPVTISIRCVLASLPVCIGFVALQGAAAVASVVETSCVAFFLALACVLLADKDLFGAEPFDPFTCGAADFPPDIQSKLDEMQVSPRLPASDSPPPPPLSVI